MICGGSFLLLAINPEAAAIHPACLPMTSRIKTFVDVSAIDETSKLAS